MRDPLTIRIETRTGVIVILFWAVFFCVRVLTAVNDFGAYITSLDAGTPVRVLTRSAAEQRQITQWIKMEGLNQYGDPEGTVYAGGTPLFNEETGERLDRTAYFVQKFPGRPWKTGK